MGLRIMIGASVRVKRVRNPASKVETGVKNGMMNAAREGFAVSQDEVSKVSGFLQQTGVSPRWHGNTLVFGYGAEYAEWVETGTRPHYPPIEPLKKWAAKVLGDENAAYAVQEKIAQEGTDPSPYVEPGYEAMVNELDRAGLSRFIDAEIQTPD